MHKGVGICTCYRCARIDSYGMDSLALVYPLHSCQLKCAISQLSSVSTAGNLWSGPTYADLHVHVQKYK